MFLIREWGPSLGQVALNGATAHRLIEGGLDTGPIKKSEPVTHRRDEALIRAEFAEQGPNRQERSRIRAALDRLRPQEVGHGVAHRDRRAPFVLAPHTPKPHRERQGKKLDARAGAQAVPDRVDQDVQRRVGVDALDRVPDRRIGEALDEGCACIQRDRSPAQGEQSGRSRGP